MKKFLLKTWTSIPLILSTGLLLILSGLDIYNQDWSRLGERALVIGIILVLGAIYYGVKWMLSDDTD